MKGQLLIYYQYITDLKNHGRYGLTLFWFIGSRYYQTLYNPLLPIVKAGEVNIVVSGPVSFCTELDNHRLHG